MLDIINIAQQSGSIATLNLPAVISAGKMQGREKGGYHSTVLLPSVADSPEKNSAIIDTELKNTLVEIKDLLLYLKINGVKAPVVLSEIEKLQALKQKSDRLGNRLL